LSGGLLAVLLYKLVKALEYETAQDEPDSKPVLPVAYSAPPTPQPAPVVALSSVKAGDGLAKPVIMEKDHDAQVSPPKKDESYGMPSCTGD